MKITKGPGENNELARPESIIDLKFENAEPLRVLEAVHHDRHVSRVSNLFGGVDV